MGGGGTVLGDRPSWEDEDEVRRQSVTQDYELGEKGYQPGASPFPPKNTPAENPKTTAGMKKPSVLSVIPTASLLHLGQVMQTGANKYGAFNWRETPVPAMTYVDAAARHLMSWLDGEDLDPESGMSHLAHMMACGAIVIDAMENGMLDDNRPTRGRVGEMITNFQNTGAFNVDES